MTYNFIDNPVPGTNLYFQRDSGSLPMDKLRCFWPMRNGSSNENISIKTTELLGNWPLLDGGVASGMEWSASNPSGGQLGSSKFGGTSDCWLSGDPRELLHTGTTPYAWTCWARTPDSTTASSQSLACQYGWGHSPNRSFIIAVHSTGKFFHAIYETDGGAGEKYAMTAETVPDNAWTFFACGFDGTSVWALINDGATATTASSGTMTQSENEIYFGQMEVYGWQFGGEIADVAYWYNQPQFTAGQLADLYNSGNGNTLLRG